MKPLLHRYWIEFSQQQALPLNSRALVFGCGVTAFSEDDALGLIRSCVFGVGPMPAVSKVIQDVDVSTLDAGHVLPNMREPTSRGIWFPLGYPLPEGQM